MKHPPETEGDFQAATGASAQVMADLRLFQRRLETENTHLNLAGPSVLASFWPRHAFDSAQLLHISNGALTFADLGAGAGFPGIVLAIMLRGQPQAKVHLVESLAKRCRFLQAVVDELALPAVVHNRRAESFDPAPKVGIVTARACAPLAKLLGYALPFTRAGASGLFLKGRSVEAELVEARKAWRFDADLIPSLSDPDGRVVRVEGLARVRSDRRVSA